MSLPQEVEQLTRKADECLTKLRNLTQEQVDVIVQAAAKAARDAYADLAALAVEETRRGNFEDKTIKNIFASEHVSAYMSNLKTVGVINRDQVLGITEIAEPVGTVAALTPVTNPTSTTIFKALMCLKTRNPIIFAFHPSAQKCSVASARIVYEAAVEAGAPENCIQWIEKPALETTGALLNHPLVSVILATGGNAMVKTAYSCGKPALGVGAGNVPAYIHPSANIERAVYDIVASKSFDNGMICASEQAVVLDASIRERALAEFDKLGGYLVSADEKKKLEKLLFGAVAGSEECATAKLNSKIVGQSAVEIAKQSGIKVPEGTRILLAECKEVSYDEPLSREKLSPVLAVLTAKTADEGILLSEQMVNQDGLGHTAAIHCHDADVTAKFGARVQAVRLVENAPSSQGAIGGIFNAFIPSLTLGCGSYGHNSVSNNVSAVNLINIKRLARRNPVIQPFQSPTTIFQEAGAIRQLATIDKLDKVSIITDQDTLNSGVLGDVLHILYSRPGPVSVQVVDDTPHHLTADFLAEKVVEVGGFNPGAILALGPTSTMNAAKFIRVGLAMRCKAPTVPMADICASRAQLPQRQVDPILVCAPTTSGGQAAVSAKASVPDPDTGLEHFVESRCFLASYAVLDRDLVAWEPSVLAARGFEAIAQATEVYFSTHASDYTDALVLHGLRLTYTHLPLAVEKYGKDTEGKEAFHQVVSAGSLIATALGNTALGLADAMAQAFSQAVGCPRQLVLPAILPNVVRFNGSGTGQLVTWPNYETFQVPQRCDIIARQLNLAIGAAGGVEAYATALEGLRKKLDLEETLQVKGLTKAEFEKILPQITQRAFDYQSHSGNPQTAHLEQVRNLFKLCFAGKKWSK